MVRPIQAKAQSDVLDVAHLLWEQLNQRYMLHI